MPASRRDRWPHERTTFPAWARLLREAFSLLAQPATGSEEPSTLVTPTVVTLVSEALLTGLLDDLEGLCGAAAKGVLRHAGPELGRTLEKGGPGSFRDDGSLGLVIVDRIDLVGSGERQRATAAFLDDLARRGISICATRGLTHASGGLEPTLQSRLSAGLVIHVPTRPTESPTEARTAWSMNRIIRSAARRHGLPASALAGGGRSRGVVQARNLAMYLARHLTGSSFDSIGVAFGGRDHTTVMRGVRAVESQMNSDAAFAADVERLLADTAQPRRRVGG
jgi:hypothetical protein